MRYKGPFAVASRDIVFESFDGDSVVLDLASGKYFGFSNSGSAVWEALSANVAPDALLAHLGNKPSVTADDLETFVSRLIEFGLLVERPDSEPARVPADFSKKLAGTTDMLRVDVYDDLADLVLVDPIHDVDEPAGWPAVKQAS